jgi:hypothetical protein
MTKMTEQEIRERLERAVAPIDPIAPPLDALRASAVKLRRFRISVGGGLLAAAAAAVTVAVVVVPASGSSHVSVASSPTPASLNAYASAHGGKHVVGPIKDVTHYAGAYTTKKAIVVVRFANGGWHVDGKPITKYGPGMYVQNLTDAGAVIPGAGAIDVRTQGGDVTYFGGILYDASGTWTPAKFGTCGHHKLCYPGTTEGYGHVAPSGSFVSLVNNCEPYCAAGTDYRITWAWSAAKERFEATSVKVLKNEH